MDGSSSADNTPRAKKAALYNEASFIHADLGVDAGTDKKLTADAIERTLSLISSILDSSEESDKVCKAKKPQSRLTTSNLTTSVLAKLLLGLLWIAALTGIAFVWVKDFERATACQSRWNDCMDRALNATQGTTNSTVLQAAETKALETCVPVLLVEELERDLKDSCRMTSGIHWQGAAVWRWLLFVLIFWPVDFVGHIIARVLVAMGMVMISFNIWQGSAFAIVGLKRQLGYVTRAAMWFGLWFPIMSKPLAWAYEARDWQNNSVRSAQVVKWNDGFIRVHEVLWRVLLTFLLYTMVGLFKAALGKYMSFHFHHRNHSAKMQKALVHENIIQQLSKPHHLPHHQTVTVGNTLVMLRGYARSHYAALCFVNCVIDDEGGLLSELPDVDAARLNTIQTRAEVLKHRLTSLLCEQYRVVQKREMRKSEVAMRIQSYPARGGAETRSELLKQMVRRAQSTGDAFDLASQLDTDAGIPGLPALSPRDDFEAKVTEAKFREAKYTSEQFKSPLPSKPPSGIGAVPRVTSLPQMAPSFPRASLAHLDTHSKDRFPPFEFAGNASEGTPQLPGIPSHSNQARSHCSAHYSDTGHSHSIAIPLTSAKESVSTQDFGKDSFLHRANSRSTYGGPNLHRFGSVRRGRVALSMGIPQQTLPHTAEALPYNKPMELEDEAVDALAQLQGAGNEAATTWKHAEGEDAGTPAARPWRPSAPRKSKINRDGDVINVQAAVQQMQTYLMDNSYIKVFKTGKKHDDGTEDLNNRMAARMVGYYIFWNLRSEPQSVSLQESDVSEVARVSGLNADTTWGLLNDGFDSGATLEDVVGAVEDVYKERKLLAYALANNQTVVQEMENAVGVALMVVLVFIVVAIFDGATVQRTWTALSAAFLSFSFIFGNSIRQVFENSIYLFFTHPFDIGDEIRFEGARYTVKSMTLQVVKLISIFGSDVTVPTAEMRNSRLHNITRSEPLWEGINTLVDMHTPLSALEDVAYQVVASMKLHPKLFGGDYRVWFENTTSGFKKELVVWFNHASSGLDLVDYGLARTVIITAIAQGLQSANATFTLPQIQKHDQNDQKNAAEQNTLEHMLASMDQVPSARTLSTTEAAATAQISSNRTHAAAAAAEVNLVLMS